MKQKHLMSNVLFGAAAAVAVMAICTSVATATEPCPDPGASDDFGEFEECKVLIEINSTDGDIGFHFLMDGDGLTSAEIQDPNFVTIFTDEATSGGALREQKLTETFAESAEPFCRNKLKEGPGDEVVTLEEFLERWTPGTYHFLGFGDDPIKGTTVLTYDLPAAPTDLTFNDVTREISWAAGDDLGECATKKQLDKLFNRGILPTHPKDVAVAAWEVVFEPDVAVGDFTIRVPLAVLSVRVPTEYLAPLPNNTLAKFEVGAIGADDNATFTEVFDICVNETTGC